MKYTITFSNREDIACAASLPGMCLWLGWYGVLAAFTLGWIVNWDANRRELTP